MDTSDREYAKSTLKNLEYGLYDPGRPGWVIGTARLHDLIDRLDGLSRVELDCLISILSQVQGQLNDLFEAASPLVEQFEREDAERYEQHEALHGQR